MFSAKINLIFRHSEIAWVQSDNGSLTSQLEQLEAGNPFHQKR